MARRTKRVSIIPIATRKVTTTKKEATTPIGTTTNITRETVDIHIQNRTNIANNLVI